MIEIGPGVEVTPEDLYLSMANIWFETLKLDMKRSEDEAPPRRRDDDVVSGYVQIIGGWVGALVIDCPAELGRLAASRMLDCDPASVSAADLQDTIGELTNIVAGNIKIDFPGECRLSFPVVTEGTDYTIRIPESRIFCEVFLECEHHPVHVALFERTV